MTRPQLLSNFGVMFRPVGSHQASFLESSVWALVSESSRLVIMSINHFTCISIS